MRGLMTSKGSLGRPKNPRVACKRSNKENQSAYVKHKTMHWELQ